MNYNKQGYSVAEVAQIIHCTPVTVRTYILTGKMPARVNKPGPSGRKSYRITRENLYEFLIKNKDKYDKELIAQFALTEAEAHADTTAPTQIDSWQVIKDSNGHEGYSASSLSELKGTWGTNEKTQDVLQLSREQVKTPYKPYNRPQTTDTRTPYRKYPSYNVTVDGRICVGNVESKTAIAIATALIEDRQCKISSITITKLENGGAKND